MSVRGFVGTKKFFWLTIGLFFIASAWIALSLGYPGIFDENTHFEIIKVHARQWSPFFVHQPAGADGLGPLTTDPSYLYHYLMSFPYRALAAITSNEMWQIIGLRFINIALFASSLPLFRKALLRTKASPAAVNLTLAVFVITPVVPFLASQINYDNMLMPLAALTLLLLVRMKEDMDQHRHFNLRLFLGVLVVGMVGCLVQYIFLPILAAAEAYAAYLMWRASSAPEQNRLKDILRGSLRSTRRVSQVALIVMFLLVAGLFTRSYVVNVVRYHAPVPKCDQVLSVQRCMAQGTWKRNYEAALTKTNTNANPVRYAAGWTYRMFKYAFYTNSGGSHATAMYFNVSPFPLLTIPALGLFIGGLVLCVVYARRLLGLYPTLLVYLFVSLAFTAILFLHNYGNFLETGQKFGINSRYLLPVILPVELLIILAYKHWLEARPKLQTGILVACLILFLQGGGALTFITASKSDWYWPDSSLAIRMNQAAQKITEPLIIR